MALLVSILLSDILPIFAIAGGAYILGIAVIHGLSPKLERASLEAVTG